MQALRYPTYRRYIASHLTSILGMWAARLTIGWLAWELSGSPFWTAVVAFSPSVPPILFSLPIGVYVDRFEPRRLLILMSSATILMFTLMAVVTAAGLMTIPWLIAFAVMQGAIFTINTPVRLAFGPGLVPEASLASAVALNSISFNTARLTGPLLGGLAIMTVGAAGSFAIGALAYLPLVLVLPFTQSIEPWAPKPAKAFWPELKDGLAFIFTDRLIWTSLALITLGSLTGRGLFDLLPFFTDGQYGTGELGLTFSMSIVGAGAILAGVVIPLYIKDQLGMRILSLVSVTCIGLITLLMAFAGSYAMTVALFFILSMCGTSAAIGCMSMIQMRAPKNRRTRIMGVWGLMSIAAMSIGALLAGSLIEWFGVTASLIPLGLICLLGVGAIASGFRSDKLLMTNV